jgi:hypothetical protein
MFSTSKKPLHSRYGSIPVNLEDQRVRSRHPSDVVLVGGEEFVRVNRRDMNEKQRRFAERLHNHKERKMRSEGHQGNTFNLKTYTNNSRDRRLEVHYQSDIPEQHTAQIYSDGIFF